MKPSHLTRLTAATKDWVPGFVSSEAAFTFTALRLWSAPLSAGSSCLEDKRPWHRGTEHRDGSMVSPNSAWLRSLSHINRKKIITQYLRTQHGTSKKNKKTNTDEKNIIKTPYWLECFWTCAYTWKIGNPTAGNKNASRFASTFWSPKLTLKNPHSAEGRNRPAPNRNRFAMHWIFVHKNNYIHKGWDYEVPIHTHIYICIGSPYIIYDNNIQHIDNIIHKSVVILNQLSFRSIWSTLHRKNTIWLLLPSLIRFPRLWSQLQHVLQKIESYGKIIMAMQQNWLFRVDMGMTNYPTMWGL